MRFCYHCMTPLDDNYIKFCPQCGKSIVAKKTSPNHLEPGTIIGGKYIVGDAIGNGGFGITYIGWDYQLRRKVAIKEFFPYRYVSRAYDGCSVAVNHSQILPRFQSGIRNFLEEARKVASLKDVKGIVNIMNFFEANHTAYIVMEYVEGKSLKSMLQASGNRMDYAKSREIILSILYTLRDVHAKGVLHRDIAPDNVMITKEGIVKLIDFGAAKHALSMDDAKSELMLKSGYAPIEQYIRNSAQGPYTDLYEVAALFYRMLTGQTPLPANQRQKDDTLILPSQMGIRIPKSAEYAMKTCLEMYSMRRLQSADAFIRLLKGEEFVPKDESTIRVKLETEKEKPVRDFPIGVKLAIGCVLCIVIACSIVIPLRLKKANEVTSSIVAAGYSLDDFTGYTVEEVQEELKNSDYDVSVVTVKSYTADTDKNGEIYAQDPQATTDLKSDLPKGWEMKDGTVTGELTCYIYTNEEISYREVKELNAYSLSKLFHCELGKDERFVATEEDGEYFDITKIEMNDGKTITSGGLRRGDEDIAIAVADIQKIYYCAGEFFCWNSFKDYVGQDINDIKELTYRLEDEKSAPVSTGKKKVLKGTKLVDETFYSFVDDEGYIFEQTVEAGEAVDTSKGTDKALLHVVGNRLSFEDKTGKELWYELSEIGFSRIEYTGSKSGTQEVVGVKVFDAETGEEVLQFNTEQNLCFEIETKKKQEPKPQTQTPVPTPQPTTPAPAPTTTTQNESTSLADFWDGVGEF